MIDEQPASSFSRRSLVKGAATAAAVGGVLAVAGPAATAGAATTNEHSAATGTAGHDNDQHLGDAAVLVRVLDARLGTLEVYTSNGHHTITDAGLAAQLTRLDS
jgi:hypothetical protein